MGYTHHQSQYFAWELTGRAAGSSVESLGSTLVDAQVDLLSEMAMADTPQDFSPDWASPPGESIADVLEGHDWTQAEVAECLGYTARHLNQLIEGKVPLDEDAALRLERVLGGSAGFWLTRESRYRERLARISTNP